MQSITAAELERRQKRLDKHVTAIKAAKAEMDAARKVATKAEMRYRKAIKEAFADGLTPRVLQPAAGISKDRVYQIIHDRRTNAAPKSSEDALS